MGESQCQCRAKIGRDLEEELDKETREGMETNNPPKDTGKSRLTLSPVSLAQAMLTLVAREEEGGW